MRRHAGLGFAAGLLVTATLARGGAFPDGFVQTTGLIRFYSFTQAAQSVPDQVGSDAVMRYRPDSGSVLTGETGRVTGSIVPALDNDSFAAPALTLASNAFTVCLWLRPLAAGSKTGNGGSRSGMIVSSGSGYYDGWRLSINNWESRKPLFELGRANGAFSLSANEALNVGFWNHLAATWDGSMARIYVNGRLSSEKPYTGKILTPKGELRIGFSGYGLGSLKMAAEELSVFDQSLPPEQIAAFSLNERDPLPEALAKAVRHAQTSAVSSPDPLQAEEAYRSVAGLPGIAPKWKAWAELASLRFASGAEGLRKLAAWCSERFENPQVPENVRSQATAALLDLCRNGHGQGLSSRVLSRLPDYATMDADGQRLFGLALASAYLTENNADAANTVYQQLLALAAEDPKAQSDVRQAYAQALCRMGRYTEARSLYAQLAADSYQPATIRSLAALAFAKAWRQEGNLNKALDAYRLISGTAGLLPHLKDEADACAVECANLLAGKPACDPESTRQRLAPAPEPALRFFVSPKGNDTNPGTLRRPFATLERARDAIRACKRRRSGIPQGGVCVYLRGGNYAVTNTFVLTQEDSGSFGTPVTYCAWKDERPVLTGGRRIGGFRKVSDPKILERLPEAARGEVFVANLTAQASLALPPQLSYGVGQTNQAVRELFQNGQPLQPARWPNTGFLDIASADSTNLVFTCPTNRVERWALAEEPMANGYWYHLWSECTVPIALLDARAGTFKLQAKPLYTIRKGRPFYVLNLLEEIDRPGEWFLDRAGGKLYVWPLKHPWFNPLTLSCWDKPFVEANHLQEVTFRGLTFQYGQQHGLVLKDCVNLTLAGNVIRRLGGTALIVRDGANVKIFGNVLHTLGHSGMSVSGGNRMNLTSGQIVIENNDVGDFARLAHTYNPALLLEGCGTRVAHNHFHHAPSSAMRIEGNNHRIAFNRIDHVVRESDDQGGIDMWGDPSYRGVVIRHNLFQDIGGGRAPCGQAGIRFDDAISGMVVYGNRFERASAGHFGGVQIHGGQNNIIDNNIFVGGRYGVSFSPWGQKRWQNFLNLEKTQTLLYTNVNIRLPPYSKQYPELATLQSHADFNRVWRNLFVGTERTLYKKPKDTEEWENQAVEQEPDDATVDAQSPFRPLPPSSEMGLFEDPLRTRALLNDRKGN